MVVDNLIVEVTRRCNMNCPHCLRGDQQNLDISDQVIHWLSRSLEGGFHWNTYHHRRRTFISTRTYKSFVTDVHV